MQLPYLLPALLTLHLIALVVMAGVTLLDFIILRIFWRLAGSTAKERAPALLEAGSSISRLTGIGAAVLITTGLLMMVVTHGVFGEQVWFRIKFALVILLVANSIFIGRKQGLHLRKTYSLQEEATAGALAGIRKNLYRFHLSQLLLFVFIIILSVFKFN